MFGPTGYADDLIEVCQELQLQDAVFVGHSVSAMIGILASIEAPGLFGKMILVGPSPRYIENGDYVGGFTADQIEELLDFLGNNHMGWASAIAPAIMGNDDRPKLGDELRDSFCRMDPGIPLDVRPDINLQAVLEQVVAELRLGVPNRPIETDFDLPEPVRCDPARIGQMASNLLGNALSHGNENAPVHLHADETEGVVTIWVANSGDPISPAAFERLFQPFFRGEVRADQQGLGLGLHIASGIAKAHGGTPTAFPQATRRAPRSRCPRPARSGHRQLARFGTR